ncbi:hypothetical protein Tco_1009797, partial [Tanacetum coccineum]
GIGGRPSLNVRQPTTVSSSNFIHDNNLRNIGPSTSRIGRNTRKNPKVDLTTCEATCSRGIHGHPSVNVRQTITVCSSNFIHDNDVRNTGPSIRRDGRNTRANPILSLTTGEATCSRGIGGRRSVNVRQTTTVYARNTGPSTSRGGINTHVNPEVILTTTEAICSSSISRRRLVRRRTLTHGPTVGSSSVAGAVFVKCVVTCFLQGPHTLTLILETLISVVVIVGLPFGSLCPPPGEAPRFLQLYIYDTDNEVENRMRHFGGIHNSDLDPEMVDGLIYFLDAYNELVQLFRTTRDKCRELDIPEFKIRLYNGQGARGYEFPTSNTLGALAFESGITSNTDFDVIIQHKDGPTQRGKKSHNAGLLQILASFSLAAVRPDFQGKETISTIRRCALHSRVSKAEIATLPHFALGELPDPRVDLDGYNIVSEMMMHDPCGAANFNASCMKGDKPMGESSTEATPSLEMVDEIQNYVEGHFILHLQDMQRITFRDRDRLRSVVDLPGKKNTTLTEWFAYNASNEMGRHLSYLKFPSEFVWHSDSKSWPPQRNSKSSIGPACEALGLLGNDREWETVLEEVCVSVTSEQLRFVFSHILLYCDVADPSKL